MNKILVILKPLLSLALLVLLVWGIYTVVLLAVRGFSNMKSELAVAIIAAAASVTVSILSLVISKSLERRAAITQELRSKKTPIYEGFIAMLYKVLFAENLGEESPNQEQLVKYFADFTEKLTIWGSDEVINTWSTLRRTLVINETSTETLFLYEDLLMVIRKDLGHKNQGFKKGTILGLFVNDIDKYL